MGGMNEVGKVLLAQQPPRPAPRDPRAALLLMLAQQPRDDKAEALKELDYLDGIVRLDNTLVSARHQQAITQARAQINANQYQGDPTALIERLINVVVLAAVPLIAARYNALKGGMRPREWENTKNFLDLAYSGQIKEPVEYLHYLEQQAAANQNRG
jgi:hypothetical protein